MTNKNSHEENVKSVYNSLKNMGLHEKAEEYKREQKQMARMFGNKDPFGAGCLIPIIVTLSSVMSLVYFFIVLA
ncbi:hypothetical protein OAR26_02575 [Candidatus Marinimicrobia bacterium]|nr:hypothetical protein [Candidatus Neomarinimicrobiota bacterium]|tara:strand:- start:1039 stop:1260 length:222 start_codon:yes stop_codon:yes gene_type:complete